LLLGWELGIQRLLDRDRLGEQAQLAAVDSLQQSAVWAG
jgi:hypothetical protein